MFQRLLLLAQEFAADRGVLYALHQVIGHKCTLQLSAQIMRNHAQGQRPVPLLRAEKSVQRRRRGRVEGLVEIQQLGTGRRGWRSVAQPAPCQPAAQGAQAIQQRGSGETGGIGIQPQPRRRHGTGGAGLRPQAAVAAAHRGGDRIEQRQHAAAQIRRRRRSDAAAEIRPGRAQLFLAVSKDECPQQHGPSPHEWWRSRAWLPRALPYPDARRPDWTGARHRCADCAGCVPPC
ncbi:hypothetical protein [Tahibacter harae]|uniref:hypothetical protein n=1 Tax=Tahibacter harae TaxID=2963937 RepID=UPI0034E05FDC